MQRITIAACQARLVPLIGKVHHVEKTKNKGNAGHHLETLLGIPHSSECLDCLDGELKAFPLKSLKSGELVPKETIAVTMCSESFKEEPFESSRVCKKLSNTLFVPYTWSDEGNLVFYTPVLFTRDFISTEVKSLGKEEELKTELFTAEHTLWHKLQEDYATIQTKANEGVMTGSIGEYLQTRTKGAGHGSTSRAFYLRPKFVKEIFPEGFKC